MTSQHRHSHLDNSRGIGHAAHALQIAVPLTRALEESTNLVPLAFPACARSPLRFWANDHPHPTIKPGIRHQIENERALIKQFKRPSTV